jgi:hypothetical protein
MSAPKASPLSKYNSGKTAPLSNQGESLQKSAPKGLGNKVSQDKITEFPAVPKGAKVKPMSGSFTDKIPAAQQIMRAVAKASNKAVTASQNGHTASSVSKKKVSPPDGANQKKNFAANNTKAQNRGNGKSGYMPATSDADDAGVLVDKSPYDRNSNQ